MVIVQPVKVLIISLLSGQPLLKMFWLKSVLQIRRGEKDNFGIIFHITPSKRML